MLDVPDGHFPGRILRNPLGIIAALEQLLHFLPVGLTRAEARAGVADGVSSDFRQTPKKACSGAKPCGRLSAPQRMCAP